MLLGHLPEVGGSLLSIALDLPVGVPHERHVPQGRHEVDRDGHGQQLEPFLDEVEQPLEAGVVVAEGDAHQDGAHHVADGAGQLGTDVEGGALGGLEGGEELGDLGLKRDRRTLVFNSISGQE